MQSNSESTPKLRFFGLGKLKGFLKPHKNLFISMIALALFGGMFDIIIPLFQRYAINNFIGNGTTQGLTIFIILYLVCILLQSVSNAISCYQCCGIEMYLNRDMRRASFNHLQTLSVGYYNTHNVGSLHSRVMSDTGKISSILSWNVIDGIWNITYLVGAIVVMLILNWALALCVIIIVPVVLICSMYFRKNITLYNRKVRQTNSEITGAFNEGITGAVTSKTLAIEGKMDREFQDHTERMRKQQVRLTHYRTLLFSIISFASSVALALVLWYGGIITIEGVILIGTLSTFMTYAQGLMDPVQWVVTFITNLISVKVNIERFTALMEAESDVNDTPEVIEKYGDTFEPKRENWEAIHGDVEFRDVTFRYPDGEEEVLSHFNLTVPQGTNVAIVGETGAGKSTLVNLVCRFYEPTQGAVMLDGKDLRERSVGWLHSNIGYVLQTPHLFSGTVRENLLYGKLDATQEELDAAVKAVNAEGIIKRLEKGYDTEIGEGGNSLSTGEKQLLSFARAILANPAIFILDEATSSIDTITEALIQDAIKKLMEGRTSFVIAHRLSTIRTADIILVVDGGKIVERGTHEQLLAARGVYYNLYTKQFKEELYQNI